MHKWIKINKLFLIAIFAGITLHNFAAPKTRVLVPKNSDAPITIIVSGKSLKYYPLTYDAPSILTTRGPGKLKIITRVHLKSEEIDWMTYSIYYRIDGGEKIKAKFTDSKRDPKAAFQNADLGFLSVGENILVELSRGEHTIEIFNGSKNYKVSTRVLFTEIKEKKIDWISLSPMYPNEPASLVTNENVVTYYRYSSSKTLKVRITGPTVLRVLNRIEFDYKMKGRISYRVEVREDKKVRNTYMLCSDRSDVTRYKKDGKRTPGKANEIVINIPSGTHTYEIKTLDKFSVLARILFPKKDIKLEAF